MLTWLGIASTLLSLVNTIVSWYTQEQLKESGADQAIKSGLLTILERITYAKQIEEDVNNLSDDDVDKRLSEFTKG